MISIGDSFSCQKASFLDKLFDLFSIVFFALFEEIDLLINKFAQWSIIFNLIQMVKGIEKSFWRMEMFDGGFFRSLEVDWAVGGIEEKFVRFGEQLARYHFV